MAYILIDSNIFLDLFLKRETIESSADAIAKVLKNHKHCLISASAITDIYYVLRRILKNDAAARDAIDCILGISRIADVTEQDIRTALNLNMKDFEDAVVASVAQRYKAECIITNNIRDYINSPVKAVLPGDY